MVGNVNDDGDVTEDGNVIGNVWMDGDDGRTLRGVVTVVGVAYVGLATGV